MSLWDDVGDVASSAVSDIGSAASSAVHAVGSAASTVVNAAGSVVSGAVNDAEQVVSNVGNGVAQAGGLVLNQAVSVANTIYHDASSFATTAAHNGVSAYNTIKNGALDLGNDFVKTGSGVGQAIGSGASAIGGGFVQLVGDGASTVGKVGGDIINTASNVGGDILHGQIGQGVTDTVSGAGHVIGATTAGVTSMASDAGHTVANVGQAAIDGGSAILSGALNAGGTILGAAGNLGKDYETTAGSLLTNALDSVTAIAKGEVNVGYGTAAIGASTIGTPVGDFYSNVFKGYGNAANATLDHVNNSVGSAVTQATTAGGDIVSSLGNGADKLGHDSATIVTDASQGNFSGAIHEMGQFGSDAFGAAKQFGSAEIEGVKALGAVASAFGTTMNGLNEAMGRAGASIVTSTGETIGGKAGHTMEDAGGYLNKVTDVTADVIQGNYTDAVKDAGKDFGGMVGGWIGGAVQDEANKIGNKEGGVFGDIIKAGGGALFDAIKDEGKDLGGSAAGAGLDAAKSIGDQGSSSNSGGTQSGNSTSDPSLVDKATSFVKDTASGAVNAVTGFINKVEQDPGSLFNMALDAGKNALGSSLGKISAISVGSQDYNDDDSNSTPAKPAHATTASHGPSSVGESVAGVLHPQVTTSVAEAAQHVQSAVANAVNGIPATAGSFREFMNHDTETGLSGAAHQVAGAAQNAMNGISGTVASFTGDSVGSLFNSHTETGLSGVAHQIGTAAQNAVNTAASSVGEAVNHTETGVADAAHQIGAVVQNAVNTAASSVGNAVHNTEASISDAAHQVGVAAQNAVNSASATVGSFVGDSVGSLLQHAAAGVADAAHQVGSAVANAMSGVSFADLPPHLLQNVQAAIGGYIGGHDASTDSIVTHQSMPTIEHVAEHFGLPTIPHSEYHLH